MPARFKNLTSLKRCGWGCTACGPLKIGRYKLRLAVGDCFRQRGLTLGSQLFLDVAPISAGSNKRQGRIEGNKLSFRGPTAQVEYVLRRPTELRANARGASWSNEGTMKRQ